MLKVMIVDDEYIMRQGLRHMIDWEGEGYVIEAEATNGDEAMKLLKEKRCDIIICDIVMPVLDGVDFTAAVHDLYPDTRIIILSGYDNFEYVKQTLMNGASDYILKPTLTPDGLRSVLEKAAESIPGYKAGEDTGVASYARMLERYLSGDSDTEPSVFGKPYNYGYFRLYGVRIKGSVFNKLERELKELQVIRYACVLLHEKTAVVLFNHEMHDGPSLSLFIKEVNEKLLMMDGDTFGVISRSFTDIRELRKVYEEDIASMMHMSFYHEGESLVHAGEIKAPSAGHPGFDFFKFNRLMSAKQYQDALSMLEAYSDAALEQRMDPVALKNQMKNMLLLFTDSPDISEGEKENIRFGIGRSLDDAGYESSYREALSALFSRLSAIVGTGASSQDDMMDAMLSYISENYREDLKLEDLASEFSFNYHYLSTYFTQHMKEGFSDYLNRLRIEKACELLRDSDMPISGIGLETGYSDHSYFSRVFKKITGRTPSEYRREAARQGAGDRAVSGDEADQ